MDAVLDFTIKISVLILFVCGVIVTVIGTIALTKQILVDVFTPKK
jgi:hypothetical protein